MTWSGTADQAMLSIEMTENPGNALTILDAPRRIVLDLEDTVLAAPMPPVPGGLAVVAARDGLAGDGRYRIVLELAKPVLPRLDVAGGAAGVVLRLRLSAASEDAFRAALASTSVPVHGRDAAARPAPGQKPFTLVIDPGHGGIDNGATGIDGVHEKDINLAFARRLRDALAGRDDIAVVLTRDDDRFVPLAERSDIARRASADLFISIHADSIGYPSVRGATVYTLSERASDTLARDVARSENAADRFAGPEWQQDTPEIHDILMDLMRRENEVLSVGFADALIAGLKEGQVRTINNPRRSAGFRVLRAPDVPSVLFELGYLSNASDAEDVQSPQWQTRVADILAGAVLRFAGRD
ncbi:N-acetylmuramoyl-L-alanine amidase [Aureimonas altamirensis]|uniref:N-acetylmuramoyl-L-alanine amidase n=1 Tax=Aureimonas altamirensis TaxID=370622 RepID=UPI00301A7DD3